MKYKIKAVIISMFWRLEWLEERNHWGRKTFCFYPRPVPLLLLHIVSIPFALVAAGLMGVFGLPGSYRDIIRKGKRQWTSYFIASDERENWITAYKKW